MSTEVSVVYAGGLRCQTVENDAQRVLTTDAPADKGGRGQMLSPTDLLAAALGTCVLTSIAMVAERHIIDIKGATVRIGKEMTSVPVCRVGRLVLQVTFPADKPLSEEERARLQGAARACPVKSSLHPDIAVEYIFS